MSTTEQKPKVETLPETEARTSQEPKDYYSVSQKSVERYFKEIQKTTASYLQSVTDLQQEIIESWKKTIDSAISLRQAFSEKLGINNNAPVATITLVNNIAEQTNKAIALQNQLILTSMNTLQKNIKTFNENAKTFSELNSSIIDSCFLALKRSKD